MCFQTHQHQRQEDQRQAEAEGRHLAFARVRLGDIVRNMQLNVTADESCPTADRRIIIPGIAAHRPIRIIQPKSACIWDASSIGAGPAAETLPAAATPAKQRNNQLHEVSAGMARHGERYADQQQRSATSRTAAARARSDQRGQPAMSARGCGRRFQHLDGNLIDSAVSHARSCQTSRPSADHDRRKPSVPPSLFHRRRNFIQRRIPEKRPAPIETTIKATKACIRAFMTENSSSKTEPTAVETSVNVSIVTAFVDHLNGARDHALQRLINIDD